MNESFSENKWKYATIGLVALFGIVIGIPTASAASPTLNDIMVKLNQVYAKVVNLPSDPASQADTGTTSALNRYVTPDLADGSVFGSPLLPAGENNKSGHATIFSTTPQTSPQPLLELGCTSPISPTSYTSHLIASSTDGLINTDFSCNQLQLGIRDVADGQNPPESIVINAQYVETENVEQQFP